MDEKIWTFSRGEALLRITRTPADDGTMLTITGDGEPRSYFFADPARLQEFQSDFEKFLLGTGWVFQSFSPERRTGRERRHFSRLLTDRRRWWTDGVKTDGPTPAVDAEPERRPRRARRQP